MTSSTSPLPFSSPEPVMKPHVVLVSFPAQGHLKPFLSLAKLLHSAGGFRVTLVNTEFNYYRLLSSSPSAAAAVSDPIPDFSFASIPDGLPQAPLDATHIFSLCSSTSRHCPAFFRSFLSTLSPPATCVITDGSMSTTAAVAVEIGIPVWLFYTHSGCGFWSYAHFRELVRRGCSPIKDEASLDKPIEFIAGMDGIRLRDLPTFARATDAADPMLNLMIRRADDAKQGIGLILNTFDELETDVLDAIRSQFGNLYTIGPLSRLTDRLAQNSPVAMIGSSLWDIDNACLSWLDRQEKERVVYVNFGSLAVFSEEKLAELAWGLYGSGYPILWVVRPDMVLGGGTDAAGFAESVKKMEDRTMVVSWCDQEAVLAHPATGVFLTHCGWNSTLESLSEGVPMVCWPFFAEQPTNCRYICQVWGTGLEMQRELKRENVAAMVREAMDGEKGREMRRKALQWKEKVRTAMELGGSSHGNAERLIKDIAKMCSKFGN
ncbi:hypothetical protein HPP92_027141 [Vanilla planifolia]|uniref:Glycosyltransferase n=1 Tax=Vanilla planifolia TaxID=51239 RepID=A0A835U4X7_VANPL|nr:hypothetical protein HPP92_027141 [Vanilla planifolia]